MRTLRISDGNSASGSIEQATHGGGGIERFWNEYPLRTPDAAITVEQANDAAAWLVAGERLSIGARHEWRRVVMFEVHEGQPLDVTAPTWTLIRPLQLGSFGNSIAPSMPRGLRVSKRGAAAGAPFLDDHAALYLAWNRRKGSPWKYFLFGAVGPDDATGTPPLKRLQPGASYKLALNLNGTAAGLCWPWLTWCWEQVPQLDAASDINRVGELTRVAEGTRGGPLLCDVSVFNKQRRWQIQKLPATRYLDALLARMDALIQQALRAHGSMDVGPAFNVQQAQRMRGVGLFLEAAYLWREFAALLGFAVKPTVRQFLPPVAEGVPLVRPLFDDAVYVANHPTVLSQLGTYPNLAPVVVPGRLNVPQNRPQLLALVNRLISSTEWFHDRLDTRQNAPLPLAWRDLATFPAPVWNPRNETRTDGIGVYLRPGDPVPTGTVRDPTGQYLGIYINAGVRYPWPTTDTARPWQRQQAQAEWHHWDEMQEWAFTIVNALNLIELLLYPEHGRRYITSPADMKLALPRVPATVDPLLSSAPSAVELLPYIMHHGSERGPWINRPETIVPPNQITIQTPPPPPPASVSIPTPARRSEYDEENQPEDWVTGKALIKGHARDWIDAYPSKGTARNLRDIYGRILDQNVTD